jgi:hypothetical protein
MYDTLVGTWNSAIPKSHEFEAPLGKSETEWSVFYSD